MIEWLYSRGTQIIASLKTSRLIHKYRYI